MLSKVVDAVDEEFLVFFECHCKCSQCSTICCLPLTIMKLLKQRLLNVTKISYVSDGCGGQ